MLRGKRSQLSHGGNLLRKAASVIENKTMIFTSGHKFYFRNIFFPCSANRVIMIVAMQLLFNLTTYGYEITEVR